MEKAIWDPYHTKVFCEICKDEVLAHNRAGGFLSKKGYKNLGDKFFERTEKRFLKKQFKNKWDALKTIYTGWMELQSATGLGWDPETKTIGADDAWWKTHIAVHPDHAKHRNGPPANLEMLDIMFRKAHVTGESSVIAGEDIGDDNEAPILLDVDGEATKKVTLGKRKLGSGVQEKEKESPFFQAYNKALGQLVSRKTESSSCSKVDMVPSMKEVLTMIRECGVKEGTSLMYTAGKLAMSREHRELFAAFETNEGRLDWLQRAHDDMNK